MADEDRQVIEEVALVSSDGVAITVVGPGCDKQNLPAGASIEHFSARFPHGGESILEQLDEWEACLLNHVHHGFLSWADAGRHEHGTALSHHQASDNCALNVFIAHFSGAFYSDFIETIEQKAIAHDGHAMFSNLGILLCFEKLWVVAFGPQAARVVIQILEHGFELSSAL